MSDTLNRLAQVIESRKTASADSSYVASLFNKGMNAILKKVGEEATETVIAAKGGDQHSRHGCNCQTGSQCQKYGIRDIKITGFHRGCKTQT